MSIILCHQSIQLPLSNPNLKGIRLLFQLQRDSDYVASALLDSLIASGGGITPPKISETTGRITMEFLPDVKLSEEARNQKFF